MLLLASAVLACTARRLRHAVDADHIAAIDNVTRNRWQEAQAPGDGRASSSRSATPPWSR
ncbi:HoxN/HupN/NixA family nickel/cobalt transporter [Cupriavidus basilensis]